MPDGRFIKRALPARVPESSPVFYPDCDGQPMAVNDTHYHTINSIRGLLAARYRQHDDVYVTGDLLLYYKEYDNPVGGTGRDGGGQFPGFVPAGQEGEAGDLWEVGGTGVFPMRPGL